MFVKNVFVIEQFHVKRFSLNTATWQPKKVSATNIKPT